VYLLVKITPLIFYEASRFVPHMLDALRDTTDKRTETCLFVRLFVRLLDGVWHYRIDVSIVNCGL